MADNTEQYCICRSTDISRFMIGCDYCNEWYHGDCIGMTAEESNYIKIFFCDICRRRNPSLKIKYHKKKLKERELSLSRHDKHDKHGSNKHSHSHSHSKKHSHSSKEREREKEKHKKKKDKHRERDKYDKYDKYDSHEKRKKDKHKEKKKKKSSSHSLPIPQVIPAAESSDSEQEKRDTKSESPVGSRSATPVPGSPIGASGGNPWRADFESPPAPAAAPHQLDPRKLNQVPPPPPSSAQLKEKKQETKAKPEPPKQVLPPSKMGGRVEEVSKKDKASASKDCGTCTACKRTGDCGLCDICVDLKISGTSKRKCRLRQCRNQGYSKASTAAPQQQQWDDLPTDDVDIPMNPDDMAKLLAASRGAPSRRGRGKKDTPILTPPRRKYNKRKPDPVPTPPRRKYRRRRAESSSEESEEEEEVKQCYGPGCINAARSGSKYCSDACGMRLAKERIIEILPTRVHQWQLKPCVAEMKNKEQLLKIRAQMDKHRQQLLDLDKRRTELDALIEQSKLALPLSEEELEKHEAEEEDADPEMTIYCVTCGHQCNEKTAVKHMEKCYVKVEARSSFASMYKARIEFTAIICDHYCSNTNSYCKRLKVLCPEHTKEPKISADEVCGCPLTKDLFTWTGDFCRLPKRKCNKHVCWEKLRRAAIDQERLAQWIKLDDLLDQERQIRVCMAERAGLLSLVLHQTIDHDPNSTFVAPRTRGVEDLVDETSCSI